MHRTHPVTWALIAINLVVFLLPTTPNMMLWPVGNGFENHQLLTYGFVHASVPHLLLNMLALVSFGATLERKYGSWQFLGLYLLCLVGAGAIQAAVGHGPPTVGASGGIFGLFLAFAWQNPNKRVWMLIPPIGMKAKQLVFLYAGVSITFLALGWLPTVAHAAHLAGMAFAAAFCLATGKRPD